MLGGKRYKPRLHIGRCRHPKSAVWRIEEVLDSNGQLTRLLHTRHNTPFTFVAEALLDLVRVKKSILRYSSVARARDFESCTANDTPLVRLQLPQRKKGLTTVNLFSILWV